MLNTNLCKDTRACFARFGERCGVLQSTYPDKECPFCKPSADVTNGKLYPVNPYYEPRNCEK